MTALDLLRLTLEAPGHHPKQAQVFDRHCVDALRCALGFDVLYAPTPHATLQG